MRSSDQAVIATNDNWQEAANWAAVQAAGFAPAHSLESVIMVSLPPGAYTAQVYGVGGGTGVTVLAVYEVAQPEMPLVNLSVRAKVTSDVIIGGFVIQGNTAKTVVIHGTGPSLGAYGIPNPLANPTITLVRSSDQAVLATNDNWQSAPNAAQIQAAGFAPAHALESAIMVTLNPGAYTVILQGADGGHGIGIFAVYAQ